MTQAAPTARHTVLTRVALGSAALLVVIGSLVLAGWLLDIPLLTSVSPNWVATKANSAVCLVASGIGLGCLTAPAVDRAIRGIGRAAATAVAIVAVMTLTQYLTGLDLQIDELLFTENSGAAQVPNPGRMSVLTAAGFVLIAATLLGLDWRLPGGQRPALVPALVTGLLGLLAFTGYLYGVRALYAYSSVSTIAPYTSTAFVVFAAGALCARPDRGPLSILLEDGPGGAMARRMLPYVVLVPMVIGWLRLHGELAGFYGPRAGLSLFALSNMLVFAGLVWMTAVSLNRSHHLQSTTALALADEQARSLALVAAAMDAIVTVDEDQRITLFNPAAERLFGVSAASCLGQTLDRLLPPEARTGHGDHIRHFGATATSARMMGRLGQVHGCHASGQLLPLEASISYTTVAGRKSYTAILRDVGEQQRVAADLARAHAELEQRVAERTAELADKNRELETFSYTVSHDLKAPLRGIDGYSLLLLTDHAARLDVEARTFLGNIRAAAAHMNQLIDDLLVYSRLERRPPELVPLDIVAVVDSSLDERRHDLGDIALSVELSPARVLADRESLAMSVRNLIDNAVKFSCARTPPEVAIRGRISADRYVLSVRDNGTGFDMKYHERIFQIFQRLHRSEDYPGTGVGLAIVRKAVERMHGRVWAESAVGSGATFYLELTCADPAPDTRVASSRA